MPLWLIGMMGVGKSTAGRLAAGAIGVPFYDTDEIVAAEAATTIAELWRTQGEDDFRERERLAVAQVSREGNAVAGVGGGAPLDEGNRAVMSRSGDVVWLRASATGLAQRIGDPARRPLLAGEPVVADAIARLLESREVAYSSLATHQIETDSMDASSVAARIVEIWNG